MAKSSKSDRLTVSIDATLKRQFDTVCTWKGLNMSDVAQSLIAEWVKTNAPPGILEEKNTPTQDKPGEEG
jgi:antitoxin component of RelBE/YafQ-DinJ toxin-antitoxin module